MTQLHNLSKPQLINRIETGDAKRERTSLLQDKENAEGFANQADARANSLQDQLDEITARAHTAELERERALGYIDRIKDEEREFFVETSGNASGQVEGNDVYNEHVSLGIVQPEGPFIQRGKSSRSVLGALLNGLTSG